ncbi:hypothetical protein ISU10_20925 [Nocardioides agariphilus]|jgi:hypothetical protein|uniref:Uncharacterized protein n=1 Tax=Nocardioides agariphilus TaxID=433664 RepID=A0A930YJ00_9ACTN|nr:hypothetical protein [Nocardioides agariphilus]MBF4770246.1 hypothetical protein [Nocardioides agariphilus]
MGDSSTLVTTRRALHAVGELVLAGPQHAATGEISLRVVPGGFATTHSPDLRVSGTDVVGEAATVAINGHTPASLAEALGVTATGMADLYPDGSGFALDDHLEVDPDAAAEVASAFAAGDAALRALAPTETPILWPEHFDIGITVDEVNYGVSGGDSYVAVPYAYVGPWSPRPQDDYWNASFGRALPVSDIPDLLAFFEEGQARLAAD